MSGIRAIVIEDDFNVASGLKWMLESYECDVVGMAGNIPAALDLVQTTSFDVAILDVRLNEGDVGPVAARLCALGAPIVYLSGYADLDVLPEELRSFPRIDKPADPGLLVMTIRQAVGLPPS